MPATVVGHSLAGPEEVTLTHPRHVIERSSYGSIGADEAGSGRQGRRAESGNEKQADPDFRQALLCEAIQCFITGDLATGKAVLLRNYVNATVGIPAKSLMRMLGPKGSPSAENLSSILTALQRTEGVSFEVHAAPPQV